MAYVTIFTADRPLGWRELDGQATVGRHHECHIWLMDTQISRAHCRFERDGDDWAVIDLGSRNGTWCDGISVDRVLLLDGDRITIGKFTLVFDEGTPPASGRYEPRVSSRPADPHEALAGTVMGMRVVDVDEARPKDPWAAMSVPSRIRPRPMPREVDLEPRPGQVGLLDAAEGNQKVQSAGAGGWSLNGLPLRLELPSVEELTPIGGPVEGAQTVGQLRPKLDLSISRINVSKPATEPAVKRKRLNVDFWVFLVVAVLAVTGLWAAMRMLPGL